MNYRGKNLNNQVSWLFLLPTLITTCVTSTQGCHIQRKQNSSKTNKSPEFNSPSSNVKNPQVLRQSSVFLDSTQFSVFVFSYLPVVSINVEDITTKTMINQVGNLFHTKFIWNHWKSIFYLFAYRFQAWLCFDTRYRRRHAEQWRTQAVNVQWSRQTKSKNCNELPLAYCKHCYLL